MALCGCMLANGQQINPIMEAVMQNYADALSENPKDYYTLYDRASQYFSMGEYARALSDIDMALEYTPEKDTDYRLAEYSLKSDILLEQKDYDGAIRAVNSALEINPNSALDLYKLGNLHLLKKDGQEALKVFQRMQRENPRSQDAFYGMAKANAMMGNTAEASDLIQEIESLGKQSYLTYCRIGDLYLDMDNLPKAADNYIIAYTMEDNSQRPIESLKYISRKNPELVMETIERTISENPDNLALNYIKAIVAFDQGDYAKAEKACKDLAANLEEDSPAVYRMMAVSQLAQNKVAEATQSIETAAGLAPADMGVMLNKAEIYLSQDPAKALESARNALKLKADNETALMLAAKAAMLDGKYEEAAGYLNDVVLGNPSNIQALLLRGYLNEKYLNDDKSAQADYTRAGNSRTESVDDLIMAALGKAKSGKKLDSDGMINEAIQKGSGNKDTMYLIAVYYAQTGNEPKAREFSEKALMEGYGNYYNLRTNREPLFNLLPIR